MFSLLCLPYFSVSLSLLFLMFPCASVGDKNCARVPHFLPPYIMLAMSRAVRVTGFSCRKIFTIIYCIIMKSYTILFCLKTYTIKYLMFLHFSSCRKIMFLFLQKSYKILENILVWFTNVKVIQCTSTKFIYSSFIIIFLHLTVKFTSIKKNYNLQKSILIYYVILF